MNNEERARELRYYLADNLNAGVQLHEITKFLDAAEARGREDIAFKKLEDALLCVIEGNKVRGQANRTTRTQVIRDCIATARAVMLGHEKEGAPLMATGAVTVEMALEAMLSNIPVKKEKQ